MHMRNPFESLFGGKREGAPVSKEKEPEQVSLESIPPAVSEKIRVKLEQIRAAESAGVPQVGIAGREVIVRNYTRRTEADGTEVYKVGVHSVPKGENPEGDFSDQSFVVRCKDGVVIE